MKKYYLSTLLKRSFVSSFLLFSLFLSKPLKAEPSYIYDCVYGNNGEIIFVMIWDGRLQYQDPYTKRWINIVYLKTDGNPGSGDVVNTNSQNIRWTFRTADQFRPWGDEFYIGWKPPKKIYNIPISVRFVKGAPSDTIAPDIRETLNSVQAYRPHSPSNINVSMEKYCDTVKMNWSKPDNLPDNMSATSSSYNIYRDSILIKNTIDTFFYDTNVKPGVIHYYQVEYVLVQNNLNKPILDFCFSNDDEIRAWKTNIGERSCAYPGSSFSTLDPPINITSSDNVCGNKIKINWNYSGNNSQTKNTAIRFRLERALSKSYAFTTVDSLIGKSVTEYVDNVPLDNHTYYYRMKTENMCKTWSKKWSDTISGKNISVPITPRNIRVKDSANVVVVNWKDSSSTESGFAIERWTSASKFPVIFRVGVNKNSFIDSDFPLCETLYYTVLSENDCGSNSGDTVNIKVSPKISNSFKQGDLKVSKGYFTSKIVLTWTNEFSNLIGSYKLFRKEYGKNDSVIITITNAYGFEDKTALSGVLYTYSIQGFTACEGDTMYSNVISENGFRSNYGTLTGKVTFEDGVAVNGAQVLVSQTSSFGSSLHFNGADNSISVPNKKGINPSSAMSVEMWIRPENLSGAKTLISKASGLKGFGISTNESTLTYWAYINGTRYSVRSSNILQLNTYTHIAATFDGTYLRLYGNGVIADSTLVSAQSPKIDTTTAKLIIGANTISNSEYFAGNIDEIRLWNIAVSSNNIKRDYNRILSGKEKGLIGYWRLDLGKGLWIFDDSKNTDDEFNENTGNIFGASWSTTIPTGEQLGAKGIVDEQGNYIINHIQYPGTGSVIDFTPFYGTHSFSPNIKSIFVGEGSAENTQDFIDKSCVKVTGNVAYSKSACPANEINVFVDNQLIYKNGQPVTTNTDGQFEINVPTGNHSISVGKAGHGFRVGVWPTDGSLHNFTEPVSGIQFIDTTRIRVIGRVVGGNREGKKKPGLGLSKNNIGRAILIFESQLKGGCSTDTVFTDNITGEYKIDLLPLRYIVKTVKVLSNPVIDFGTIDLLDLSRFRPVMVSKDTIFNTDKSIARIDTAAYQVQEDFIFHTTPEISVTNTDGSPFIGEKKFNINRDANKEIDLTSMPFGFPVFSIGKKYTAKIHVFENYLNHDNNSIDNVPIPQCTLYINNDLEEENGMVIQQIIQLNSASGDTIYSFTAGSPNLLANSNFPEYSYTKAFKIDGITESRAISWQPGNNGNGDLYYRAFILGGNITNKTFFTRSPDIVSFILRDPPGSNSTATLETGSQEETSNEFTYSAGAKVEANWYIKAGLKTNVSFLVGPETIIDATVQSGFAYSTKISYEGLNSWKETTTTSKVIQTNGNSEMVGGSQDLFIGKSAIYAYGTTKVIMLVPDSLCQPHGQTSCLDGYVVFKNDSFRIGKRDYMYVSDSGSTEFIYTQDHIENYLIPELENLRNNIFESSTKYVSKVAFGDENYGSNNDDPVWGNKVTSSNPITTELQDYNGQSYKFTPSGSDVVDSIRWYNQQIRLWKNELAKNEKEKLSARLNKNISISSGASYEYSSETVKDTTWEAGCNVEFEVTFNEKFEGEISGNGAEVEVKEGGLGSFKYKRGHTSGTTSKYSYHLQDDNQGDYLSINIKKPDFGGDVFQVIAGQTQCPWESGEVTKYDLPLNRVISYPTRRSEKPVLNISPNIRNNVPADQAASFTLNVGNASETNGTMWYMMKVVEQSNPNGATVLMDGLTLERVFEAPAGITYNKTITVTKNPGYDDYPNIQILLYSSCEFENFTNGGKLDAIDTVTFSVHFVPSCSNIAIIQPENKWIINLANADSMPILIGKYDVNFNTLKRFQLQYKNDYSSQWTGIQSYWKDTAGFNNPDLKPIPKDQAYTIYTWDVSQITDGAFDIRAVSQCPLAENASPALSGIIDRIPPHSFGTPQPADNVLSPNDEIMMNFNEDINTGKLSLYNFDIRGILNGSQLVHDASIAFDGQKDYVSIPTGLLFTDGDFTTEFWAKRETTGKECILSQGGSHSDGIYIGFDASNHIELNLGGQEIISDNAIINSDWHHYAISYNHDEKVVQLFYDGEMIKNSTISGSIMAVNSIVLGKCKFDNSSYFKGNIHELRIWNLVRNQAELVANMNLKLSGKEYGLAGNWPLNEANGLLSKDLVHHRNATIFAEWNVFPSGSSYNFDGNDDYLELEANKIAFNKITDFTIEFWFKGSKGNNITFLSNGKGDGTDNNKDAWSIHTNDLGQIIVSNNGNNFIAVPQNYFDNDWHHFAVVVNRTGNNHAYLDGELKSMNNNTWNGFGGASIWVGCRGWLNGTTKTSDQYFTGQMDEIRIWNLARKQDQLQRYMNQRLQGNEIGLQVYLPFERYQEDAGVQVLSQTIDDQSQNKSADISNGNSGFSVVTPNIVLQRPVEQVNFKYTFKNDVVLLQSTDPQKRIENCILDVTVRNVEDLHGNPMQSPETWTVYVNMSQIKWKNEKIDLEKKLYDTLTFTATIENLGGSKQSYSITNLPNWLTCEPSSGTLAPLSTKEIVFTVNSGTNIGNYSHDVYLHTDFDFDEKLPVNLRVYKNSPDWKINPSDYVYTMNVVGQLKINGVISDDIHDKVAAFVGNQCRGVGNIEYVKEYDAYEVFLDMYSNTKIEENLVLRVWDASAGRIHQQVDPKFTFQANTMVGSPSEPIDINATDTVYESIALNKGWNWISFNLKSPDMNKPNTILADLNVANGGQIKGKNYYDQYSKETGWVGSLSYSGGLRNEEMYMVELPKKDTINYSGLPVVPEKTKIKLVSGWNWIGFIPNVNMEVNDALSHLNPGKNDVIKGLSSFAMYDKKLGWIGSLDYLEPNKGYMYFASKPDTLIYPNDGLLSNTSDYAMLKSVKATSKAIQKAEFTKYPYNMSVVAALNDSILVPSEGDILIAANDKEILGQSALKTIPVTDQQLHFLTINNNKEDNLKFKYYSALTNKTYDVEGTFGFVADARLGSIENPIMLKLSSSIANDSIFDSYIYPNPLYGVLNMAVFNSEKGDISISIYDMLSRVVYSNEYQNMSKGWNNLQWKALDNSNQAVKPGVYMLNINTSSKTSTFRIILKK